MTQLHAARAGPFEQSSNHFPSPRPLHPVISTGAMDSFIVHCAAEKPASLPHPQTNPGCPIHDAASRGMSGTIRAKLEPFLIPTTTPSSHPPLRHPTHHSVILPTAASSHPPPCHFDRSNGQLHRPLRSGETRCSTTPADQPKPSSSPSESKRNKAPTASALPLPCSPCSATHPDQTQLPSQ